MMRDQSMQSAARSSASRILCSRSQTPAACQSRKRRQQLMPEPQPISWGNISHGMPDCSTNAGQHGAIVKWLAPWLSGAPQLERWQQRFDQRPQVVIEYRFGHVPLR